MTYQPITAKYEEGHVVLPSDVDWPSGITVRVIPEEDQRPTIWEVLAKYDGIAEDLPEDLAENLDHYIHGHPKK